MASSSATDGSAQEILELFKDKVKDAIGLLPSIAEEQRKEAWVFWQLVSVAVKIAIGGRGSAIPTKRERLEARRGRPRKTRALWESIKGHLTESRSLNVHDGDDDEDGNQMKTDAEEANESMLWKRSETETQEMPAEADTDSVLREVKEVKAEAHGHVVYTQSDSKTLQSVSIQPDSDTKPHPGEVQDVNISTTLPQEIVIRVSRGPDLDMPGVPEVSIVSIPESAVPHAVSQTTVSTSLHQVESSPTDLTSGSTSLIHPASVSFKRKRGRPRKISSVAPGGNVVHQKSSPAHDLVLVAGKPAEEKTWKAVSDTSSEYTLGNKSQLSSHDHVSQHVGQGPSDTSEGRRTDNMHITTAQSEKEISEDVTQSSTSSQTPVGVRRSERRLAPNRDKLFCYFDRTQPEETTAEESALTADTEVKLLEMKSQETKTSKLKTKEEKLRERTCPICHAVLCSYSSMAAHLRTHTGDRPFTCHICDKGFTTKANCERHEATHVGLKAFTCPECQKSFTEKKSMKIHMRSHTGERPYKCEFCDMGFFQTGTLKTHMDRHTGHKRHLCDFCGKAFRQRSQLRLHVQRHNKHMPFSCGQCDKTFYTRSDKERHMAKHTGERPFSCNLCQKTFTRMQYLREHKNVHLGRRPYQCSECGLAFPDRSTCHRHVQKHRNQAQKIQPQHTIEITSLPEGGVIINPHNLPVSSTDVQYIVAADTLQHVEGLATTSTSAAVSNNPESDAKNGQAAGDSIISSIVDVGDGAEIYHFTLVDSTSGLQVTDNANVSEAATTVDFSAINLLASATTQLSLPK